MSRRGHKYSVHAVVDRRMMLVDGEPYRHLEYRARCSTQTGSASRKDLWLDPFLLRKLPVAEGVTKTVVQMIHVLDEKMNGGKMQGKDGTGREALTKPVAQLDFQTRSIIARFPSGTVAARAIGSSTHSGIMNVCHGRQAKCRKGFAWRFLDETEALAAAKKTVDRSAVNDEAEGSALLPPKKIGKNNKTPRPVAQLDFQTRSIIAKFPSGMAAARAMGYNPLEVQNGAGDINRVCHGPQAKCKNGFAWRFLDETGAAAAAPFTTADRSDDDEAADYVLPPPPSRGKKIPKGLPAPSAAATLVRPPKPVAQLDFQTRSIIARFPSGAAAARAMCPHPDEGKRTEISLVCRGRKTKCRDGFAWRFLDDAEASAATFTTADSSSVDDDKAEDSALPPPPTRGKKMVHSGWGRFSKPVAKPPNKSKPVAQLDFQTRSIIARFPSGRAAARAMCPHSDEGKRMEISQVCNGSKAKCRDGFAWRFLDDAEASATTFSTADWSSADDDKAEDSALPPPPTLSKKRKVFSCAEPEAEGSPENRKPAKKRARQGGSSEVAEDVVEFDTVVQRRSSGAFGQLHPVCIVSGCNKFAPANDVCGLHKEARPPAAPIAQEVQPPSPSAQDECEHGFEVQPRRTGENKGAQPSLLATIETSYARATGSKIANGGIGVTASPGRTPKSGKPPSIAKLTRPFNFSPNSKRRSYSPDEDQAILDYLQNAEQAVGKGDPHIGATNGTISINGNKIWQAMEVDHATDRSWSSMRERYRRVLLPGIGEQSAAADSEEEEDVEKAPKKKTAPQHASSSSSAIQTTLASGSDTLH